jgi:hypothetical protein
MAAGVDGSVTIMAANVFFKLCMVGSKAFGQEDKIGAA